MKKRKSLRSKLSAAEKKIYDAIIIAFPATKPAVAYGHAIQGGVRWNFISK